MGHDLKQRWNIWQLKIDVNAFNLDNYLAKNSTEHILWNEHQTAKSFNDDWWIVEAKEYIKKGDKIIIWVHGIPIGIYALGEVAESPYYEKISEDQLPYYKIRDRLDKKYTQVPVNITVDLFSKPISHRETRKMGVSEYRHPIFRTLYDSKLPESPGPIKRYSFMDFSYGESVIDEYGDMPFKPLKEFVWMRVNQYIQESGEIKKN